MAFWRPVTGHIQRLDSALVSVEDIEKFFADERIIGRGQPTEDDGYTFEVAIAGRRRRVATLDEEGEVFRGRSVSDLIDEMRAVLRKVAVELDGAVLYGEIDLGTVDVSEADFDVTIEDVAPASEHTVSPDKPLSAPDTEPEAENLGTADTSQSSVTAETSESSVTAETADPATMAQEDRYGEGEVEDTYPELHAGPVLVVSDISMSEMPVMAKIEKKPISVSTYGSSRVIVALDSIDLKRRVFPRPSYAVALSVSHLGTENPVLIVRRDNHRQVWDWSGELPLFEWIAEGSPAEQFGIEELGAGAIARLAVADIIDAKFADVREALLEKPENGARALIKAIGLPSVFADVLEGRADLEDLGGKIFQPKSAGSTFEETFAWEVAGEGVLDSDFAKVVRETVVKRPWVPGILSVVQASVGGGIFTYSMRRKPNGKRSALGIASGVALMIGAGSRIITSNWVQNVMAKQEPGIKTWQERDRD